MAFQKIVNHHGLSGSYLNIFSFRVEPGRREASACIALWQDAAHRQTPNAQPIADRCVKVRLTDELFDQWLSASALQAAFLEDPTYDPVKAQIYRAAKAGAGVVSDFGPMILTDAVEV